jgi:hypothetical protein
LEAANAFNALAESTGIAIGALHCRKISTDWRSRGVMAGVTGLEPATSGVTGRRSNQLSYTPEALASEAATDTLPPRGCQCVTAADPVIMRETPAILPPTWDIRLIFTEIVMPDALGGFDHAQRADQLRVTAIARCLVGDDGIEPPTFSV